MLLGRRLVGACFLASLVVADTQQHDCSAVRVQILKEQQEITGKLQSRLDECTTASGRVETEKNGLAARASGLEQRVVQLESEVKTAAERYAKELKARDDMLSSMESAQKAGEELAATRTKLASALKEGESLRSELERSRADARVLQETADHLKGESERLRVAHAEEVNRLRGEAGAARSEAEKAARAEVERARTEAEEARASVERARNEGRNEARSEAEKNSRAEMERIRRLQNERVATLERELRAASTRVSELEGELSKRRLSEQVIFSEAAFKKQADDAKRVGKAFLGVLHQKVVRLVGQEAHDLVVLQTKVWYSAVSNNVRHGYVAGRTWARRNWLWNHVKSHALWHEGVAHFEQGVAQMQKAVGSILSFVEERMERIITNMSAIDPSIRSLFPTNFVDRCFAFAYCFLLAYLFRSLVTYLLSYPLHVLHRRPHPHSTKKNTGTKRPKKVKPGVKTNNDLTDTNTSKTPRK